MEASSPPKRMTRARAAAHAGTSSTSTGTTTASARTAKVAPAAAKSTTTRTAASMKRKTRADENEDDEESHRTPAAPTLSSETMTKPVRPRGRPKKIVDPMPEPEPKVEPKAEPKQKAVATAEVGSHTAARATRGRPKSTVQEPPKTEPTKTTRTRTRKTQPDQDKGPSAVPEPVKKTARGRAAAGTAKSAGTICTEPTTNPTPGLKSNIVRPASRIANTKKSVTFQEPEKENMVPPLANKAKSKTDTEPATGMRAKPVRKTVAAGRATRTSARTTSSAEKQEKPTPLSPKKDSQNRPLSRASNSDDELAGYDKTPVKPLMKSPVKPPNNKKVDLDSSATTEVEELQQRASEDDELAGNTVFASPARKLPSTPFRDTLKSPAKRAEGMPTLLFPPKTNQAEATQAPSKTSILQSPAKRPQVPIMAFQAPSTEPSTQPRSPVKMSFLQSPAKRPISPMKFAATISRSAGDDEVQSLATRTLQVGDQDLPLDEAEEDHQESEETGTIDATPENADDEDDVDDDAMAPENVKVLESCDQLEFPGRLSAVLPRHADPALQDKASPLKALSAAQLEPLDVEEPETEPESLPKVSGDTPNDSMDVDQADPEEATQHTSPLINTTSILDVQYQDSLFDSYPKPETSDKAEIMDTNTLVDEAESNSGNEAPFDFTAVPATPTPAASKTPRSGLPSSAIRNAGRAIRSVSRGSKLSFTPLAKQMSGWSSGSPLKTSTTAVSPQNEDEYSLIEDLPTGSEQSPAKGTFFDDEMRIRAEMDAGNGNDAEAEMMAAIEADLAASFEDPIFDDIPVTNEDMQLAAEANEMSLLEPEQVDEVLEAHAHDDTVSEASQEYGDENAVPIDPALLGLTGGHARQSMAEMLPVTPVRPSTARNFNTTTKVPLKPADDSTPMTIKKRSASASRMTSKRPGGPIRNATVISYSPTKDIPEGDMAGADGSDDQPPVTPTKSDIWSSIGTPARTPRQDLDPSLLRGAVVFVDVHTSEGADASTVFVDLLTQMGARCVKSWPWNPTSPTESDFSTSKIGITHVVYKDGGKRTMEKVRESGGVVQCVGVAWVLDCERENEWLEEAPYYIDTSLVPRGGARRRKSMEPKALTNLNGTLVTPIKQTSTSARDCQTVPNNHMSRRDSTVWMRSPTNPDDDEEMLDVGDDEWNGTMLTPVPKTPAPEALHRYVSEMDVTPETPGADWSGGYSPEKEQMLTRTAPPKQNAFANLGQGLLSHDKDQNVLMRLMAARRKSMQFAPKIASPLSKAWN